MMSMTNAPDRPANARYDAATELIVSGALKLLPKLGYDATVAFMLDAGVGQDVIIRVLGNGPRRDQPTDG